MAGPQRRGRIEDQIQRELSAIISTELKDPRVGMVTITGVTVTSDLQHAKVYVTTLAPAGRRPDILSGLASAAGFMRSLLGRRLKTFATPELRFEYDDSIERGVNLTQLIDQAVASSRKDDT